MPERFRPLDAAALLMALSCWALASLGESHAGIVSAAIIGITVGLAICVCFGSDTPTVLPMFAWGFLARTVVCLWGYYQGESVGTAFWTGSNSDSERFFFESAQSLRDAVTTFEDPGFPFANVLLNRAGNLFGEPHYLVNVQLAVLAGSLFGPIIYLVAAQLVGARPARLVGWLGALHPTGIAYASGLMRDAVVAATGWGFVGVGMRAWHDDRHSSRLAFTSFCLLVITYTLRSLSALIFAAVFVVWAVPRYLQGGLNSAQRTKRLIGLAIVCVMLISIAGYLAAVDRSVGQRIVVSLFRADFMRSAGDASPEALAPSGITARVWGAAGLLGSTLLIPFSLVAPFPFFTWAPPPWLGGPVRVADVLLCAGGLLNQLILVVYIRGAAVMLRRRDLLLLWLVVGMVTASLYINVVTLGAIRYTMLHAYPLFFIGIAVGWYERGPSAERTLTAYALWLGALSTLYATYFLIKFGVSVGRIAVVSGLCLVLLALFGHLQGRAFGLSRPWVE